MAVAGHARRPSRPPFVSTRSGRRPAGPPQLPRLRLLWLVSIVVLLSGAIWGRLAYWQVANHGELARQARQEVQAQVPLPALRGSIYDRNGQLLALNSTVYNVTLAPDLVAPSRRAQVAESLVAVLGVQFEDVMALLESNLRFGYVAKRVPKDQADKLTSLGLIGKGVGLEPQQQRTYLPGGSTDATLAAGLFGFVDYSGQGQRGIEQFHQDQLGGRAGYDSVYRDLYGDQLSLGPDKRVDAINGSDLTLTMDADVQYTAEQAIADGVKANHAESGSVIVMDPKTGGIVAWANYPGYNANQFASTQPAHTQDPIVSSLYEPGSVMKVVTMAGAIDSGKATPLTVINDPGYVDVGGSRIRDWDLQSHGNVTLTRVLEASYNVGAIKAQQLEGIDSYFHYLQAFGFGTPTGVDVAGEADVRLRRQADWKDNEMATTAFGQGIAVNMVQIMAALNAVVNNGQFVQPHVVQRIGDRTPSWAAPRQVIKPETATELNAMMRSVVQHGSGYKARIPGFELDEGGKTGTSQIPENGRYSTNHVWASYFGYLPAQNPRFTMLVMVNKPNNGSWDANEGYYVSAPIWKRIAQQMILNWRISPEQLPAV
jgi:cell division protein FtsI/penicillin-binding protein 2